MSAQHTPGPWEATQVQTVIAGGDQLIADCATGCRGLTCQERDANARLIAAAPDLLEACAALIACHDNGGTDVALALGRAAIAKAGGAR